MQSIALTPELIRGALEIETTDTGLRAHRLPAAVRRGFPDPQLLAVEAQPSGVRLALTTEATELEVHLHPQRTAYRGISRPRGAIDVVVEGALVVRDELTGGDVTEVDLATGAMTHEPGPDHITRVTGLAATSKRVEFWLPHNEAVEIRGLYADAPVAAAEPTGLRWVHHGSSISHGSNAVAPTAIWPVVTASELGADLTNLGFGGSCLIDQFVARTIRDLPADLIRLKLGINVVNLDGMRRRTFTSAVHGFLDTIRDGHPTTPLLLVTPVWCGIHENTPGPGAFHPDMFVTGRPRFAAAGQEGDAAQGRLTLQVVREALAEVAAQRDDEALHLVDGLSLFGAADAEQWPLGDDLHPDTEAHRLIGERFAQTVRQAGVPLG